MWCLKAIKNCHAGSPGGSDESQRRVDVHHYDDDHHHHRPLAGAATGARQMCCTKLETHTRTHIHAHTQICCERTGVPKKAYGGLSLLCSTVAGLERMELKQFTSPTNSPVWRVREREEKRETTEIFINIFMINTEEKNV